MREPPDIEIGYGGFLLIVMVEWSIIIRPIEHTRYYRYVPAQFRLGYLYLESHSMRKSLRQNTRDLTIRKKSNIVQIESPLMAQ